MQAWMCENPIGVDALQWRDWPTPKPGAGEVLLAIAAASLNFPDLLIVQNKYQFKPEPPFVPGAEFAGVVLALGEGVTRLSVGQRVACLAGVGGFGTHALAREQACLPLPDGLALDEAAALIMTYGTSHHALFDRAGLKAGETVLVLGASGGVGTAAIQLAKLAGARVIAAASSAQKCALCRSLGADETLLYGADLSGQALRESIKSLTKGLGPDVVYDPVGGDLAEPVFRSIAWRGRYLVIGFAGGQIPALPWNLALLKGASLIGVFYGDYVRREPQRNAAMLSELAAWCAQGKIRPVIDQRLPMTALKDAYARMGSRAVMGKVLLVNEAVASLSA